MSNFRFTRSSGMPPVVLNLLIINILVFVAQSVVNNDTYWIEEKFALHGIHSAFFQPYQVLTYMFMHGSFGHLFFNMFALWMFGSQLENYWGSKRFLIFYIVCGLGSAALHLLVLYFQMEPLMEQFKTLPSTEQLGLLNSPYFLVNQPTVGASGAIFGCLAAFGYLFPNTVIQVYFFLPIKAKWFVLIYAALELWLGIRNSAGDNVAHFAHLGGAVAGLILVLIWNRTNRKRFY